MTPFLSLDGLSAVDAADRSPKASPVVDGELGKAFQKQYSQQNSEPSDPAAGPALDAEGTTESAIALLNLETGENLDLPQSDVTDQSEDVDAEALLVAEAESAGDSLAPTANPAESPETEVTDAPDTEAVAALLVPAQTVAKTTPDTTSAPQTEDAAPAEADTPVPDPVAQAVSPQSAVPTDPDAPEAATPAIQMAAAETADSGDSEVSALADADPLQQVAQDTSKAMTAGTGQEGAPQDKPSTGQDAYAPSPTAQSASQTDFTLAAATDATSQGSDSPAATSTIGVTATTAAAATASAAPPAQPVAVPTQTPAHYVAVPDDIPSIISQELSSDAQTNHVRIQLDPPELGRVSLEFKFDSQGLQHVIVTADSAEAIRRIRAFHPDLVSVLDQHGLSSQDMTFREQASGQGQADDWAAEVPFPNDEADIASAAIAPLPQSTPSGTASSGLDIRV